MLGTESFFSYCTTSFSWLHNGIADQSRHISLYSAMPHGGDDEETDGPGPEKQRQSDVSRRQREVGQADDYVEEAHPGKEGDFEVKWEDGDEKPMNPRKKSKAQRWLITLVVSSSSACV